MSTVKRKATVGTVVSNKMDKTAVVAVEWKRSHPLYKKSMKRTSKFAAHDERNECRVGDSVRIVETRPLSRNKRWRVAQILQRREVPEVKPGEIDGRGETGSEG